MMNTHSEILADRQTICLVQKKYKYNSSAKILTPENPVRMDKCASPLMIKIMSSGVIGLQMLTLYRSIELHSNKARLFFNQALYITEVLLHHSSLPVYLFVLLLVCLYLSHSLSVFLFLCTCTVCLPVSFSLSPLPLI